MSKTGNMTLKEARAKCRELAIDNHTHWWSLCWHKRFGYYPAESYHSRDTNHICWVDKSGVFKYATKENERKHNLKGNVPWIDISTGKRRQLYGFYKASLIFYKNFVIIFIES